MNLFRSRRAEPAPMARRRSRGQVIVIFAGAMLAFMGLMAIVIDVSWYWANTLRVQRAADAAALAGVVWLPSQYGNADITARAEAKKNGYIAGGGTTITTAQDTNNDRRLIVTISASVPTFFARVVGIQSFPVSRTSKAEFILPVAMGSPENYYGNFGTIRDATFTGTVPGSTGFDPPTNVVSGGTWTNAANAYPLPDDNQVTVTPNATGSSSRQIWGNFNFTTGGGAIPAGATIDGVQVSFGGAQLTSSGANMTNCNFGAEITYNASAGPPTWSSVLSSLPLTTTKSVPTPNVVGSASNLGVWGGSHTWVQGDFTNTNFRLRLTWNRPSCSNGLTGSLDTLTVNVSYHVTTVTSGDKVQNGPGTPCANGVAGCLNPDGLPALNPHKFWGTMNTEGAENVNGDAYQPYYDTRTGGVSPPCPVSSVRACYDAYNYYNYAVEMPAGSTGGYVYIFDPVFCATRISSGTGDRWFSGAGTGMSSWYELLDTNDTPYNLTDDIPIADSGSTFVNVAASDSSMGGSGGSECKQVNSAYGDGRDYHDSWYLLNPGAPLSGPATGTAPTIYRLHTTGTNPFNAADIAQRSANGEQSFSIFATASGTLPKVYGLGAMQMFSPLEVAGGSAFSEFYIAQVPQAHAGKTLELSLWDPGDTGNLAANLQFEIPTASGWAATSLTWSSTTGTSNANAQSCNPATQSGNSIVSNVGGGVKGVFNGCWLTVDIAIPANYTAQQNGWWKIRYNMSGNDTSSDVTTWTAKIRGNPVHLVLP